MNDFKTINICVCGEIIESTTKHIKLVENNIKNHIINNNKKYYINIFDISLKNYKNYEQYIDIVIIVLDEKQNQIPDTDFNPDKIKIFVYNKSITSNIIPNKICDIENYLPLIVDYADYNELTKVIIDTVNIMIVKIFDNKLKSSINDITNIYDLYKKYSTIKNICHISNFNYYLNYYFRYHLIKMVEDDSSCCDNILLSEYLYKDIINCVDNISFNNIEKILTLYIIHIKIIDLNDIPNVFCDLFNVFGYGENVYINVITTILHYVNYYECYISDDEENKDKKISDETYKTIIHMLFINLDILQNNNTVIKYIDTFIDKYLVSEIIDNFDNTNNNYYGIFSYIKINILTNITICNKFTSLQKILLFQIPNITKYNNYVSKDYDYSLAGTKLFHNVEINNIIYLLKRYINISDTTNHVNFIHKFIHNENMPKKFKIACY